MSMMVSDWRSYAPWRRKHFSQKGHVEFENSLGPKFFGNFDLVKDMLKFVAKLNFHIFCLFFWGGWKGSTLMQLLVLWEICSQQKSWYCHSSWHLYGNCWIRGCRYPYYNSGDDLRWVYFWVGKISEYNCWDSPPHLLTLPSVKLTANNFLGRFRLHLDAFILSECVESTNDDFVLVLHTWK